MSDLLKEAIADAKAVRETALQNAKMALEEAFTPQLKSMLSAKLKEEDLEEDSIPVVEEEEVEDGDEDEEVEESTETSDDTVVEVEDGEDEMGDEEEVEEGSYHEDEDEDEEESDEDNLDLEAVIRELESELSEAESEDEEDEDVEESVEEPVEESEEEFEIDENELKEEDEDEEDEDVEESVSSEDSSELSNVQNELKEYKEAVSFLKDKLHEVNILNAKLLFTNKLFKEYVLDNGQKLRVVETFDRAQTTREIKLVYSTLAEQFGDNSTINRKSIKESASAPVASTKPSKEATKVISEESEVANRFKKLAGLING